jgi:hypothetical protein
MESVHLANMTHEPWDLFQLTFRSPVDDLQQAKGCLQNKNGEADYTEDAHPNERRHRILLVVLHGTLLFQIAIGLGHIGIAKGNHLADRIKNHANNWLVHLHSFAGSTTFENGVFPYA